MSVVTIRKKHQDHLLQQSERAENLLPTLAYDPESKLYLNDDSSMSFAFLCYPLSGFDSTMQERVNSILNQSVIPDETIITFSLFRSPDISDQVDRMLNIRINTRDQFFRNYIRDRASFLSESTFTTIQRTEFKDDGSRLRHDLGYVHDMKLIISVKVPIGVNLQPTAAEIEQISKVRETLYSNIEAARLSPDPLDNKRYIRLMQTLLNHSPSAGWRFGRTQVDEHETINKQIFDFTTQIDVEKNHLKIGDTFVQTLSAKQLPEQTYFGTAMNYIGNFDGSQSGIRDSFLITANIYFPNNDKTKSKMNKLRTYAINQAYGPMLKFVPVLGDKVRSFNEITTTMKNNRLVRMSLHVAVFSPNEQELSRSVEAFKQQFTKREIDIKIMEDSMVMLPVLLNSLPMCADLTSVKDIFRYKTLATSHVAPFLPIMGEWKGTGTAYLNFISRNGQVLNVSTHDTGSNQNFTIVAQSGSGKSFLTNEIILSYMSEGAKVWVIDVGRSYEKLCDALNGQFVHFGDIEQGQKVMCLNPFPLVEDWEEEVSALVALVENMIAENDKINDYQRQSLTKIMSEIWQERGREMITDDIADRCLESDDIRIRDLGVQLFSFTSKGSYGKYFVGENTVSFQNDFIVLELEELKAKPHLQRVVLLQLIYQIQQAVYLGGRECKRFALIDEAWDLLNKDEIRPFLESAYRRFRKYRASCGIVTQSLNDLFTSSTGQAIYDNSATSFTLAQKSDVIEALKKDGRMDLSDMGYEILKTVKTRKGAYSEIFVKSEFAQGIGRLIVSPFQSLLYSTAGDDIHAIDTYRKKGHDLGESINLVLRDRGLLNDKQTQEVA